MTDAHDYGHETYNSIADDERAFLAASDPDKLRMIADGHRGTLAPYVATTVNQTLARALIDLQSKAGA